MAVDQTCTSTAPIRMLWDAIAMQRNLNTVKTDLKSVFSKLDVQSRSQALLLVEDLRGSAEL